MAVGARAALRQSSQSSPKMPHVEALSPLYRMGVHPRLGQAMMIAGRSGSMKSTFALWLVEQWGLDTLYFSADMSAMQASTKLAAHLTQRTTDQVEEDMKSGDSDFYNERLEGSRVRFSFGTPIKWQTVGDELDAWVTQYNSYPQVIVLDNLMDIENAESDYSEQMFVMQNVSDISRETGATVLVLHHATDKGWDAVGKPFRPPSRAEVKGGLSEKPEMTLSVAFNNDTRDFHVSPIKNRMGYQDPTANHFISLRAMPEKNTFYSPEMSDYIKTHEGDD